jgi:hypothetical protein
MSVAIDASDFNTNRISIETGHFIMIIKKLIQLGQSPVSKIRQARRFRPAMSPYRLEERAVPAVAPYIIPLELVNIKPPGTTPEYKLGIYVGLGGGSPKLYEFDTGGEGFWAAYSGSDCDCQWWGPTKLKEQGTMNITYSSGNVYKANLVSTTVTLFAPGTNGQAPAPVVTTGEVDLAQITRFTNNRTPGAARAWRNALKDGEAPLFGNFYGDFGASLQPIKSSKGTNIFSILPQIPMPAGLDVGFVVHVGAIDSKTQPYLQIGIDPSATSQNTSQVAMNVFKKDTTPVYFPVTNVPAYSEQVANANFELHDTNKNLKQTFSNIGWTIDTGAPTATIWQSLSPRGPGVNVNSGFLKQGRNKSEFLDNVELKITANSAIAGKPGLLAKARTGKPYPKIPLSAGRHTATSAPGWNYVNTGLWTFTQFDISFNLSKGLVGFSSVNTSQVG